MAQPNKNAPKAKCPIEGCGKRMTVRGLSRHLGEAHDTPPDQREALIISVTPAKQSTPPADTALRVLRIAFPNGIPVTKLDDAIRLRDTIDSLR